MAKPTVNELYTQYEAAVRSRIFCMIRDFPNAVQMTQDISQDVWIRVMKNIDKMSEDTNFGGWIKAIAGNLTIDHMRKIKTRGKYETISDEQVSLFDQWGSEQSDPLLERCIQLESIAAVYKNMRPVEALANYFAANGYKYEDIPGILQEKLGAMYQQSTIRTLVYTARQNFILEYKKAQQNAL